MPVLLIARRLGPLTALAAEIRAESGVDCVPAAIDLAAPDAFDNPDDAKAVGECATRPAADRDSPRTH